MNVDAPASGSPAGGAFLTPSASHGFNTTPNSASGPPVTSHKSLAQYIADLQRSLRDAFEPALPSVGSSSDASGQTVKQQAATSYNHDPALLHPLAVSTGSQGGDPPGSTSAMQVPWDLLTSALSNFEYQILNNAGVTLQQSMGDGTNQFISSASNVSDKDRIRLLALMRESGALTLTDLITDEGVEQTKKIINRRKEYKIGFPGNFASVKNVKEVLESIAKDAGWETFQGADEDAGGPNDDSTMETDGTDLTPASTSHTITMAGKGVVLDVDFDIPSRNQPSESTAPTVSMTAREQFGAITAVRFSYGLEGSTDPGVDKLLSRQAKANDWSAMRESILALSRLDDIIGLQESMSRDEEAEGADGANDTVVSGELDPFSAMKTLSMKIEEIFKSELEVVSSAASLFTTGHGLATSYHSLPYTELTSYVQPYILHTEEWDKIVQSGFQNEELAALSQFNEDIMSIKFKVEKASAQQAPLTLSLTSNLIGNKADLKSTFPLLSSSPSNLNENFANGLKFIAELNKSICISAATGRRLQDILLGSDTTATFPVTQMQGFSSQQGQLLPTYGLQGQIVKTLEELLLPDKQVGSFYELGLRDMGDNHPPLRARIMPVSTGVPSFKLDQFAFESIDQLMAVVEVLRLQACYNDILSSLFAGSTSKPSTGPLEAEASITLESLLSDAPLSVIDVSVQTDTDISWPPAITLVYLLPYLPSWLPVTATLRVCPSTTSSSGYQVGCSFASTETLVETGKMKDSSHETTLKRIIFGQMEKAKGQGDSGGVGVGPEEDRSKAMMEEILAISGDLKMVMKWINAKVETAADAIVSLYRR